MLQSQAWIKDISYGNQVKDEDKRRSFALVNKATGKAIKHGFGSGYLVGIHIATYILALYKKIKYFVAIVSIY